MSLPPSNPPVADPRAEESARELIERAYAGAAGLRARLWIACLLPALGGAVAVLVIAGLPSQGDALFDPAQLGLWPWAAAGACLVLGIGVAMWLDHGIVNPLRALTRSLADHEVEGLRSGAGWGELGLLSEQVRLAIGREQVATSASHGLERLRDRLAPLRSALDQRDPERPWTPIGAADEALAELTQAMDRAFARDDAQRDRLLEALRERRAGAAEVLAEAHESAAQAERGFVEATALLTTVRELQRLALELGQELAAEAAAPVDSGETLERFRAATAEAIEELVAASVESVEHLGAGLLRVRELADQVHLLSNRATLIALNVVMAGGPGDGRRDDVASDLKALARDVRALTDRTQTLAAGIDAEVSSASARMREVRSRVADRLDHAPAPEPGAAARPGETATRLLERVREMVQDAARKGERLSQSEERVSRAAERLAHRLAEESRALETLAGGPEGAPEAAPPAAAPRPAPGLTLLERGRDADADARGRGESA